MSASGCLLSPPFLQSDVVGGVIVAPLKLYSCRFNFAALFALLLSATSDPVRIGVWLGVGPEVTYAKPIIASMIKIIYSAPVLTPTFLVYHFFQLLTISLLGRASDTRRFCRICYDCRGICSFRLQRLFPEFLPLRSLVPQVSWLLRFFYFLQDNITSGEYLGDLGLKCYL